MIKVMPQLYQSVYPETDVQLHVSFAAAITAIGATPTTLIVSNEQAIAADITIPATLALRFTRGGSLNIATTKTVTINGHVEAGLYQIFSWDETGTVVLGANYPGKLNAEWFGFASGATAAVNKAALLMAISSAEANSVGITIKLPRGLFNVDSEIDIASVFVTIEGSAEAYGYEAYVDPVPATRLVFGTGAYGIRLSVPPNSNTTVDVIKNLKIDGADLLTTGLELTGNNLIENVVVENCVTGIHIANGGNSTHLDKVNLIHNTGCGLLLDGTFSTPISIKRSNIRENYDGIDMREAWCVSFENCVIESNTNTGLHVNTNGGSSYGIHAVSFNHCWFENNGIGPGPDIYILYSGTPPHNIGFANGVANIVYIGDGYGIEFENFEGSSFEFGAATHDCAVRNCSYTSYVDNGTNNFRWIGGTTTGGPTFDHLHITTGPVALADGDVTVASGHGVDFSAAHSANSHTSLLLNAYEEGTWTPVLNFGGAHVGMTGIYAGTYTKTGRKVHYYCNIELTALGSSTGGVTITGLPFSTTEGAVGLTLPMIALSGLTAGGAIYVYSYAATLYLAQLATTSYVDLTHANFTNTSVIRFNIDNQIY